MSANRVPVRAARGLRRSHAGWFELGLFALAYAIYFGVRALTQSDAVGAVANAARVLHLERGLDLDWEDGLQAMVLSRKTFVDAANAIYIWGHWPVLISGGVVLFHVGRAEYSRLRTAILLSGAFGLIVFAFFPVAPPRLASLGLQDTITLHASGYHGVLLPSLVNEYAAMPSFHAGWSLLLGIELLRASRPVLLRALALLMPVAMALAVVATANHFVLDVVAGALTVIAALLVVALLEARPRAKRRLAGRVACGKPATGSVPRTDAPSVSPVDTRCMFSSPTRYHRGSHVVEVLPGESHSDAWAYVIRGGPFPDRYPCSHDPALGRVRRRVRSSRRRQLHGRRALTPVA